MSQFEISRLLVIRPISAVELSTMAFLFSTTQGTVIIVLGGLVVAIAAAAIPMVLRGRTHTGPAIRIDKLGIRWHRWSGTVILWDHIAAIRPYRLKDAHFLGVTLSPSYLDRPKTVLGFMSRINRASGFGDLALNLGGTDGSFDDMVRVARFHHDKTL